MVNKSVFVTGAHDGTGFAIASRFAKEGYAVFVGSRDRIKAETAAAKQMKEKGGGAIVFIGSNSSIRVTENRCAYCSSKSAINAMSKSFAVDWGKYGIRSNCVLPGMIKTVRWENNENNCKYCLPNYTPIEDIATFEDVTNAAWYLGSDQSRNTTGAEIIVDGGVLSQRTPNINRELWTK